MKAVILACLFVLLPVVASAQMTGAVVEVFRGTDVAACPSTDNPNLLTYCDTVTALRTATISFPVPYVASPVLTCGLTPSVAPASIVNPNFAEFDDLVTPGKVCRTNIATLIGTVPVGVGYKLTMKYTDATTISGRSGPSVVPFGVSRLAAPTGVGPR